MVYLSTIHYHVLSKSTLPKFHLSFHSPNPLDPGDIPFVPPLLQDRDQQLSPTSKRDIQGGLVGLSEVGVVFYLFYFRDFRVSTRKEQNDIQLWDIANER